MTRVNRDMKAVIKLQLILIGVCSAPVSCVQLVPQCLSQGQMKVSCLSQGGSPQYSWTLDGRPLTDSELFSGNTEASIIVLRQNILGHLICSVRSQVSNSFKGMNLTYCAVTPSCDGRENEAQCFGALGGAVDIQLMDNMINDLRRNDSGEYKLEMFDGDGKMTGWKTLHLSVIAPVSSVQLVPQCLSQGQRNVSCVSQGDSPQYSWTLDGHKLTDSELFSGNLEVNIIILRHNISGHLVCSVRNEVSNSFKGMNLTYCAVKTSCDGRKNGARVLEFWEKQ
ncbi:uncharacterized protein LOC129362714 [Poeciliopsis prolifica]|uniref:uncharacterized protein LOC129362714 n=1 Tax=Poeciliopsis prolifica TaxID=188132 RepID=UPI0024136619|nr:uncharacterized protein LOC129362714 [Poeciliopsis prolifica]